MIQSTELKDLILGWYENINSGEILGPVERFFSRQQGFLAIGNAPDEWYESFASIFSAYKGTASQGPLEVKVRDLNAYSEGTVGWTLDRVTLKLPNGSEIPFRHTFVFHKENGEWKIVHAHYSVSVSNEDIGYPSG